MENNNRSSISKSKFRKLYKDIYDKDGQIKNHAKYHKQDQETKDMLKAISTYATEVLSICQEDHLIPGNNVVKYVLQPLKETDSLTPVMLESFISYHKESLQKFADDPNLPICMHPYADRDKIKNSNYFSQIKYDDIPYNQKEHDQDSNDSFEVVESVDSKIAGDNQEPSE